MSNREESFDRQVSKLFRAEVASAHLSSSAWNAISSRMGEQDAPGPLSLLRGLWSGWQPGGMGLRRYLAPAATVIFIALVVAMFIFFMNSDDSGGPAPAASSTPGSELPTPAASPALTRDQATQFAEDAFARDGDRATAVDNPHDMVTRLMRVKDIPSHPEGDLVVVFARHEDTLIWLAQVEGTSRPPQAMLDQGAEDVTYRFNAVAIDASTGEVVARMQSEYEPFILPLAFLPEGLASAGIDERNISRDSLPITEDAIRDLIATEYGDSRSANIDAMELALVRYSSPNSGTGSIGPTATPTAAGATPTPGGRDLFVPSGQATSAPLSTATPTSDRLSWLVILPSRMGFDDSCLISGPAGERHLTCWMSVDYYFFDVETGAEYDGGGNGFIGPNVTNEERQALSRFAWTEGWWALWHEVREYNREPLPAGLAAQLDRPNAPTPTPYPPTATPPADATPTSIPTPTPSATPAPTSTPAPMRIERVASFGSPVTGTIFEDLLARVPDNEDTRQLVDLADIAGPNELYGLQPPSPGSGVDDETVTAYLDQMYDLYAQGYPVDLIVWPTELARYTSRLDWYPYVAFDFWSVEQTISVRTGGPTSQYDIAFGQFDPRATADALAACECDQPEVRVRNGTEFYAWGEELIGDLALRFAPPIYDHIGRGPRLLVRDGEAYYTISDDAMLNMIDTVSGDAPSLADDSDYLLTAQWLATLGNMATMSFSSITPSFNYFGARDEEVIASAPLLEGFDMAGSGLGHDGERLFVGVVIANPDEATAQRNADLLEQRLREGLTGIVDRTWEETIDLAEISVQGRFTMARLYLRDVDQRSVSTATLFSLTVSE